MTVGLVLVVLIVWMAASLGSFSFGGVERSGMKGKDLDIAGKSLMTHFSLSSLSVEGQTLLYRSFPPNNIPPAISILLCQRYVLRYRHLHLHLHRHRSPSPSPSFDHDHDARVIESHAIDYAYAIPLPTIP